MSGDKRAATDAEEQQSPKRQRAEENEEEEIDPVTAAETARLQAVLNQLAKVEEELEKDDDKLARDILAIETKHNKAKRPAYEKRAKLLEDIPGFWKQAVRVYAYVCWSLLYSGVCVLRPPNPTASLVLYVRSL